MPYLPVFSVHNIENMEELNEQDFEAYQEDVEYLVGVLKDSFESDEARFYEDEMNETLYIELEGLQDYSQDEIEEIAGPILEELDLDFEEIILLPLK
jgi:hypothetical protein